MKDIFRDKFVILESPPGASDKPEIVQTSLIDPANPSISRQFTQLGFVVLRSVFSKNEMAEFRTAANERFPSNTPPYTSQSSSSMVFDEPFNMIFTNEKVIGALKEILGDDFIFLNEQTILDSNWSGWHADTTNMEVKGFHEFHWAPTFLLVQCALYLQSNEEGGFGLDVIPHSHVLDDPTAYNLLRNQGKDDRHLNPGQPIIQEKEAVRLDTKAGDIVFFHYRLTHRASPRIATTKNDSGRKFGVFTAAGVNNQNSRRFRTWLDEYTIILNEESRPEIPEDYRRRLSSFGVGII